MAMRVHDEHKPVPPSACPICGHKFDAATQVAETGALSVDAPKPKRGDLSVCIRCGSVLRFGRGQKLRELSDAELLDLTESERRTLLTMQRAVRSVPWEDH